jgi:hypothetical protein
MNWDSGWDSNARPVFRALALLLGLVMASVGGSGLFTELAGPSVPSGSTVRFLLLVLGWGVVFVVIGVRGRLLGRRKR